MGLGWKTTRIVGGELMIWHDGGPDDGTGALIAVVPGQKLAIAMLANSTSFGGNVSVQFAIDIFKRLLEDKFKLEDLTTAKPERISPSKQVLLKYEGSYTTFGMTMDVKARKNKLKGKIGGMGLNLIPVSETEFRVTHWMDKIGLTKIIRPPVEFDKIRIAFPATQSNTPEFLIINLNHIAYEICPRYPELASIPDNWNQVIGSYQLSWRLPGDKAGPLSGDLFTISMDDEVLKMSGVFGPILPLNNNFIRILGGPFAGETMEYVPSSGHIIHQNAVFVPHSELN
jgi:hypothetical protein